MSSLNDFDDTYFLDLISDYDTKLDCSNDVKKEKKSLLLDSTLLSDVSCPNSFTTTHKHQHIESGILGNATDKSLSENDIPSYILRARAEVNDDPEGIIYIDSSDEEEEEEEEDNDEDDGSSDETSSYYSAKDDFLHQEQPQPQENSIIDLTCIESDDEDCLILGEVVTRAKPLTTKTSNNDTLTEKEMKRRKAQSENAKHKNIARQMQQQHISMRNCPLPTPFTASTTGKKRVRTRGGNKPIVKKQKISVSSKVKARPIRKAKRLQLKVKTSKKTKRPKIDGIPYIHGTLLFKCIRCNVTLTGNQYQHPLQQLVPVSPGAFHCLGCARFLSLADDDQERDDMTSWILTGKIPKYDKPKQMSYQEIKYRLKSKITAMKDRQVRGGSNPSNFITQEELEVLVTVAGYKCCATDCEIYYHDVQLKRVPYWALTIDHIIALTHVKEQPWVWSVKNLQVMSHSLNAVKGHYDDEELNNWYRRFKTAHYVILD